MQPVCRLMTESMMPLTSQPSMLDGLADRQREGTQTSEENIRQVQHNCLQNTGPVAAPSSFFAICLTTHCDNAL